MRSPADLMSLVEVAEALGKTAGAAKVWMHRHSIGATRLVSVEARSHRALYDGEQIGRHAAAAEVACPGCVAARRGRTRRRASGDGTAEGHVSSAASGPTVSASPRVAANPLSK